jgi:hypothetical protein
MGHNIEQGAGGLSFVEIQRFCGICPKTFEIDCMCENTLTLKICFNMKYSYTYTNNECRRACVVASC